MHKYNIFSFSKSKYDKSNKTKWWTKSWGVDDLPTNVCILESKCLTDNHLKSMIPCSETSKITFIFKEKKEQKGKMKEMVLRLAETEGYRQAI